MSAGPHPIKIQVETRKIQEVPLITCIPDQAQPCPVVFAIPGHGGSRTSLLPLAYRLAERGLACVSFDPIYHGERADRRLLEAADPALGGIYPPDSGLDVYRVFLQVIRQCSVDIQGLLTSLADDRRLDLTRTGVTGFSMGAYASFLAFAWIPVLRTAVPMLGLPTFARRWQDLLDECAWSNPAWGAAFEPIAEQIRAHTAWVQSFDPARKLIGSPPRPLLVMSGDQDTDQPKFYILDWLRSLRPVYAASSEDLCWNIYPAAHTLTEPMEVDAVEWLVKYLA
jgi:uncharacterized protein